MEDGVAGCACLFLVVRSHSTLYASTNPTRHTSRNFENQHPRIQKRSKTRRRCPGTNKYRKNDVGLPCFNDLCAKHYKRYLCTSNEEIKNIISKNNIAASKNTAKHVDNCQSPTTTNIKIAHCICLACLMICSQRPPQI